MRIAGAFAFLAVVCAGAGAIAAVADDGGEAMRMRRQPLVDLDGVQVAVQAIPLDIEKAGLAAEQIRIATEIRLRKAGIAVLSEQQRAAGSNSVLCVVLAASKVEGTELIAWSLSVELRQAAILKRDAEALTDDVKEMLGTLRFTPEERERWRRVVIGVKSFEAVTWSAPGRFGTVGTVRVRELRENVDDEVDRFVNDWLAANPRGQRRTATSRPYQGEGAASKPSMRN